MSSLNCHRPVNPPFWISILVFIFLVESAFAVKQKYEPPTPSQLGRAFFDTKLAFITVATVWIFFLIIFIIFRLYYLDERSKLHQVFDDCSPSTAQYKYVIRLRIGKSSTIFQRETSAIMIDLLDPRQYFITRLSVSPSWLKADVYSRQSSDKPKLRSLKFLLNRANLMPTIGAVRLSHDSYFPVGGYIFVHSLEIRNLVENTLTQIPVFKRILVLPPDANEMDQVFSARRPSTDKKKDENLFTTGYSPYLTFSELLVFTLFYSNVTLFTTIFFPNYLEISDFDQALFNGLFGAIPSSTCTGILLIFYRFFLKILYARAKAMGPWSSIRIIFLFTLTLNGVLIGLVSSLIQSRQSPHTLTYWSLAILVANIALGLLIIPLLIIGSLYQFWSAQSAATLLFPSFASKAVDEPGPGDKNRSSLIGSLLKMVDEKTKSRTSKAAVSGTDGFKTPKAEADPEEANMQRMIVHKRSMEEGLIEQENEVVPVKSARERIINQITSVLGRPYKKEPISQGEEKVFEVDKRIENQSNR